MEEIKFCADCKWFIHEKSFKDKDNSLRYGKCANFAVCKEAKNGAPFISPESPDGVYASSARGLGLCGPDGKYWERRDMEVNGPTVSVKRPWYKFWR